MTRLYFVLSITTLLSFLVSSLALTCPSNTRPLPPDSCIQLQPSEANFGSSHTRCESSGFDGLLVVTPDEFPNLVLYSQVIGLRERFHWLGYMYNTDGTTLQSVLGETVQAGSPLLDMSNYGSENQQPAGAGVCIAISGDGKLHRIECATNLPAFCQDRITAPSASAAVSPDRFVTVGSSVSLNCSSSGDDVTISWIAGRPGSLYPMQYSSEPQISITSFSVDDPGAYYCVASNGLGSFVSEPIVLVIIHNSTADMESPEVNLTASSGVPRFNSSFTLTCTYSSSVAGAAVQWFINGRPVNETSRTPDVSSTLILDRFQEEGYYQCFVRTENGDNSGATLLVTAQPGQPGVIDQLTAQPYTRTSIFISWLFPEILNTHDAALLRYQVLYHNGSQFNMSLAAMMSNVVPVQLNGEESRDLVIETSINMVELGTRYAVKVRAITQNGNLGEISDGFSVATTYGSVPGPIQDLKVFRTSDNKTVVATWEDVVTAPPMGYVSIYQIQYRDDAKGSMSTVVHDRKYNYLVVAPVINANSYQIRVRSGVIIERDPTNQDPVVYDYSSWSEWRKVEGIVTVVPPVPPTGGLSTSRVGAIAAGVVVGVVVLVLVLTILIVGLVCLATKKSGKTRDRIPSESVAFSEVPEFKP